MCDGNKKEYGIYIHIPYCRSKCDYCAFVSTPDRSSEKKYISALIGEISQSAYGGEPVDSIYIGGGTPSCLTRGALYRIMCAVRDKFKVLKTAEITIECNPESVDDAFVSECCDCGANRISMGLQSSCDEILHNIGRIHNRSDFVRALDRLSSRFDNISSDLILGLPDQQFSDIKNAVELISKGCSHASVYALTVEQGTPLYDKGYSPDDDKTADMYDLAVSLLYDRGFHRYEVSNFALNGRECAHNKKYWNCEPYIGFGVAAHGYDGESTRYKHSDIILSYINDPVPIKEELSLKDRYNEYVMLRLRTEKGIDTKDFRKRFGWDFCEKNYPELNDMFGKGYLLFDEGHIRIAPEYIFVMNGLIELLMLD